MIWIFAKGGLCNSFQDPSFKVDKSVIVMSFCKSRPEILGEVSKRVQLSSCKHIGNLFAVISETVRICYLTCRCEIGKRFGTLKVCLTY